MQAGGPRAGAGTPRPAHARILSSIYVFVDVCMYVCIYVCVCMYVCVHTYICICTWPDFKAVYLLVGIVVVYFFVVVLEVFPFCLKHVL